MSELCAILTPILTSLQIVINQLYSFLNVFGFTQTPDLLTPIAGLLGCSLL